MLHRWSPIDTLRLLVRGADLSRLAVDGGPQRLLGDTVVVSRVPVTRVISAAPLMLPLDEAARARFARELRAEPMLEVESPAIVALSRRLRRRDAMARNVVFTLSRWVADSIGHEAAVMPPSAVGTLRVRRGDANEHAQLFVALARAAGIPARTVSGLLLIDGRFYYHAWAEVMLHDWVGVDPTTGDLPVDASHVRLLVGGLAAQQELTRLSSGLDVTILSQTTRRPSRAATP
jgi:transglutaminase-like putative cysteine protease